MGKQLGVSGIGEGVVWWNHATNIKFKVKGEKHSVSKVKTLAAVDVEKVNSALEFVENTVTDNRLKQGLEQFKEPGKSEDTGNYIKWVVTDVMKEEHDTLSASGLTTKDVTGLIASKARKYWQEQL